MALRSPEFLSGDSTTTTSSQSHSLKKNKRKLLFLLLLSSLLLAAFIATVTTLCTHRSSSSTATTTTSTSHAILDTSCAATRYPSLCLSAISSSPSLLSSISSHRDVILASLNLTASAVHRSVLHVRSLSTHSDNLTAREHTALADCLDMFHESLDELHSAAADLRILQSAPGKKDRSLPLPADPEILISAAMTNQESCLDGFSHDQLDRRLRDSLFAELTHVVHMCCNALAMVKDLPGRGGGGGGMERRRAMGFGMDREGWPEWMGEWDRRRMAAEEVAADAVVAADGSGDYSTIGEAVAAAPAKSKERYVIRIKAGTYRENVDVPKKKTNIMLVGDGRNTTVITGSRNVVDGSTTFRSATLGNMGFKNTELLFKFEPSLLL